MCVLRSMGVWDKEVRTFSTVPNKRGCRLGRLGREREGKNERTRRRGGWEGEEEDKGQGTGGLEPQTSQTSDLDPSRLSSDLQGSLSNNSQLALASKVLAPSAVLVIHSSCHLALFAQEKLCKSLMHRVTSRHLSDASGSLSPVFKLTLLQPASQFQPASQTASFFFCPRNEYTGRQEKKVHGPPSPPENIESKGSGLNTRASHNTYRRTRPLLARTAILNPYSPLRLLFYYSSY